MSDKASKDKPKSSAQIQAELDQMRRELVDSVDELSTRLDPRRIASEAVDTAKDKADEVKSRLAATASAIKSKLNPDDEDNWAFDAADVPQEHAAFAPDPRNEPYPLPVVAGVAAAAVAGVAWLIISAVRKRS